MASDAFVRHVVTFGRVLREAGLEVGPGRVVDALRALDAVQIDRQEDVYFALRQTLVSRQDELDLFDRAFTAWFMRAPVMPPERRPTVEIARRIGETPTSQVGDSEPDDSGGDPLELGASGHELLREKDFGEMTPDEFLLARRLIAAIASARPRRSSRRRRRDTRGDRLDMRRLIRQSLRTGGDPVMRPVRARKDVPRKLVVLCDVSGLDGLVRSSPPAVPARDGRFRARRRGVRVRHDADAPHRRARQSRSVGRARSLQRRRARLGERHAHRRLARRSSTTPTDGARSRAARSC